MIDNLLILWSAAKVAARNASEAILAEADEQEIERCMALAEETSRVYLEAKEQGPTRTRDLQGNPYSRRFTVEYFSQIIAGHEISGWYVRDNVDERQMFGQMFVSREQAAEWADIASGSQRAQDLTFLGNLK